MRGALPSVVNGHAILRDANLNESSYDEVVMWTGCSCEHDDVIKAHLLVDRLEIRPGTNFNKTILGITTTPNPEHTPRRIAGGLTLEQDSLRWKICFWPFDKKANASRIDKPQFRAKEIIFGVFYLNSEEVRDYLEESDAPQILLQARQAYRQSNDSSQKGKGKERDDKMNMSMIAHLKLRTMNHDVARSAIGPRMSRNTAIDETL